MSRISRLVIPGCPHHVVQRGVRSLDIFSSEDDMLAYLGLVCEFGRRCGLSFWAWCLMTNHVHLLVVPEHEKSLARGLGEAHRRYTVRVNSREEVRGHLFQERFYSYPVQEDLHLLAVARYIELNPVKARLARSPGEYRWSSAQYHLNGVKDMLVDESPLREMAPDWREFLSAGLALDKEHKMIEHSLRTGRPFGTSSWVKQLEIRFGRPLAPRRGGRPRKTRDSI